MKTTATTVLKLLEQYSPIQWGRAGPTDVPNQVFRSSLPPHVIWRFKLPNEELENKIVEAIQSFHGKVDWVLNLDGRNWVLQPKEAKDFYEQNNFHIDVDADLALEKIKPEIGERAHEDLAFLIEHLKTHLSS